MEDNIEEAKKSDLNVFDIDLDLEETDVIETDEFKVVGREFTESRYDFSQYDKNFDRVWLCMKGELTLKIKNDRIRMKPGDVVKIPSGVSHGNVVCQSGSRVLVLKGKFH